MLLGRSPRRPNDVRESLQHHLDLLCGPPEPGCRHRSKPGLGEARDAETAGVDCRVDRATVELRLVRVCPCVRAPGRRAIAACVTTAALRGSSPCERSSPTNLRMACPDAARAASQPCRRAGLSRVDRLLARRTARPAGTRPPGAQAPHSRRRRTRSPRSRSRRPRGRRPSWSDRRASPTRRSGATKWDRCRPKGARGAERLAAIAPSAFAFMSAGPPAWQFMDSAEKRP